jgi:hypothetical protein
MRSVVIISAITMAFAVNARSSQAYYEGPWCAHFWGGDTEYERCSMRSFEMCLDEIRGTGGLTLCSPNPRYQGVIEQPDRAKPRRQHSF